MPKVKIYTLGGTGACGEIPRLDASGQPDIDEHGRPKIKKEPVSGKIRELIEQEVDPTLLARFDSVEYEEDPDLRVDPKLTDSSQYTAKKLTNIGRTVRRLCEESDADLLLPMGSDNMPPVMQTIADSVPPELMHDRIILGVASQTHAQPNRPPGHKGRFYPPDTEPVQMLEDAMQLLTWGMRQWIAGRILVCCRGQLRSPRGLRKIDTRKDPFVSRFSSVGYRKKHRKDWKIPFMGDRPDLLPHGRLDQEPSLVSGVEKLDLQILSTYKNVLAAIKGWLEYGDLSAVVLTAPGDASLRVAELPDLSEGIEYAAERGIPVALAADPLLSDDVEGEKKYYTGNLAEVRAELDKLAGGTSSLIDGGPMTPTEVALLLGSSVAEARQLSTVSGEAITELTMHNFNVYKGFLQD